jgi:hypothetical protein
MASDSGAAVVPEISVKTVAQRNKPAARIEANVEPPQGVSAEPGPVWM